LDSSKEDSFRFTNFQGTPGRKQKGIEKNLVHLFDDILEANFGIEKKALPKDSLKILSGGIRKYLF